MRTWLKPFLDEVSRVLDELGRISLSWRSSFLVVHSKLVAKAPGSLMGFQFDLQDLVDFVFEGVPT